MKNILNMTTSDTISEKELNELFIFMNSDPMNEFIYYADLAKWRAKIICLIPIRHKAILYRLYSVDSVKIYFFTGRLGALTSSRANLIAKAIVKFICLGKLTQISIPSLMERWGLGSDEGRCEVESKFW